MPRCSLAIIAILLAPAIALADTPKVPTFEADVLPILNAHCLQCHGGVHQKNGLDLRTLPAVLKGGQSGAVIVPGKPDDSLLWKKLAKDEMPKTDNKVSDANKKLIRSWIEGGAKAAEKSAETKPTRPAMKPAAVAKIIDRAIDAKLTAAKIPASPRSDDAEFLRRVYLDITGKPPTATQAAAFLADPSLKKREVLVDSLLASDDFGRHFGERWVNLFYLTTVNQRPASPEPFIEWMAQRLNADRGWNEVVRDILTASGPLADAPQGLFFYYNADMNGQFTPKIIAGNVGQVFLGVQLQCAECHDHPFSNWKQMDFWSVAAFFGQTAKMETVENKNTPGVKDRHLEPGKNGKPQTPLKEIAIGIPNDGEARNGGKKVPASLLDGTRLAADPTKNHRPPFAEWLTAKDNRMFARAAVNRFWAHFFARGFVNPLNDFADHNTPSHPELLDALADEFVASGFDLKHLIRCVCLSDGYQRTSRVVAGNEKPEAEALFARMTPKVLTPEQLYDALCVAMEVPDLAPPIDPKNPPKKPNPKAPPPPSQRSLFVGFFRGPGEMDEPTELKLGVPHALRLMNQSNFNTGGKVVDRVMESAKSPSEIIDGLFLAVLSRKPTPDEREKFTAFVGKQKSPRDAYSRILWVLLNSSEFMLNN
ncbi:MAG: PSD1 and planctomycete cytochrome C domain-containing protein [Planctomycetes bacterium]|nr:PSD1 and planctomycete cytochrome C domain-containing protein [Planctomycetota bacterium]